MDKYTFLSFLRSEGALDGFVHNIQSEGATEWRVSHCDPSNPIAFFNIYLQAPYHLLTTAFLFAETPEGGDYWRELSRKWFKCLDE